MNFCVANCCHPPKRAAICGRFQPRSRNSDKRRGAGGIVDDHLVRLEASVGQLRSAIQSLEQRVAVLEVQRPGMAAPAAAGAAEHRAPAGPAARPAADLVVGGAHDPIAVLSLIGRLFLVLAGGFFLRAMTEAGLLVPAAGIAMAFAYGLVWLFLADRACRRRQPSSAFFHAIAFAMVAFPLLVEATTRFAVLTAASSAAGIFLVTAALLLVAWLRRLPAAAWVTVVAALPTSIILMLKTGHFLPFGLHLVALGVATLWLCYELDWTAMRWPTALAADLVVAGATLRALAPQYPDAPRIALILQWSLLGAYVASIAIRTLVRGRTVGWFELAQTAAVLVISFGGTVLLSRVGGALPAAIGLGSLLFGAACYGIAFVALDRREDLARNLYFYTTLALVLVLAGSVFLLRAPWPGLVFALLAVLATGLWARGRRPYMLLHGAAYAAAAAAVSGALVYGTAALAADPAGPWARPGAVLLILLVASVLSTVLAAARPAPEGGVPASAARLVLVLVCAWLAAGCVTGWLAPALADSPTSRSTPVRSPPCAPPCSLWARC